MTWTDEINNNKNDIVNQQDTINIKAKYKYYSLSPMVTRVLDELGESIWGRNVLFFKKYKINAEFNYPYCWDLFENKEHEDRPKNLLRVYISEDLTHFDISIPILFSGRKPDPISCKDLSEQGLKEGLIKMAIAF
jgi:hypothetical protein